MAAAPRVVFDCVVFVQAAARPQGPAKACLDAAIEKRVELVVSPYVLDELRDVLSRWELRSRFPSLTDSRIDRFVQEILVAGVLVQDVPQVYRHPLDEKDEPYINLALAAGAQMIVTRDKRHMLSLMDSSTAHGSEFVQRFPQLQIVTPEQLLQRLQQSRENA
jgi:putative PIN family toxin of toxin-antitoxin system